MNVNGQWAWLHGRRAEQWRTKRAFYVRQSAEADTQRWKMLLKLNYWHDLLRGWMNSISWVLKRIKLNYWPIRTEFVCAFTPDCRQRNCRTCFIVFPCLLHSPSSPCVRSFQCAFPKLLLSSPLRLCAHFAGALETNGTDARGAGKGLPNHFMRCDNMHFVSKRVATSLISHSLHRIHTSTAPSLHHFDLYNIFKLIFSQSFARERCQSTDDKSLYMILIVQWF